MKGIVRKNDRAAARRSNTYRKGNNDGMKGRLKTFLIPVLAALVWVGMVGGITLGLLYSYRWVTRSPFFSMQQIILHGNHYLEHDEVISRAGLRTGQNVLDLNIARIQLRLTEDPWVESARVKRVLPDTLILTVREREAVFWIRSGTDLFYADRRGRKIGPVVPEKFISLPFLHMESDTGPERQALEFFVRRLQGKSFPFSDRDVAWVRVAPSGAVSLFLERNAMTVVLDCRDFDLAAAHVSRVWKDLRARNELSRTRVITVMGDRAWVEFASG